MANKLGITTPIIDLNLDAYHTNLIDELVADKEKTDNTAEPIKIQSDTTVNSNHITEIPKKVPIIKKRVNHIAEMNTEDIKK